MLDVMNWWHIFCIIDCFDVLIKNCNIFISYDPNAMWKMKGGENRNKV